MSEYGLSNIGIKQAQAGANNSGASSANAEKSSAKSSQIFDFGTANEELFKKYGLTEEQFKEILLKYPDFSLLNIQEKEKILASFNNQVQAQTAESEEKNVVENTKNENVNISNQKSSNENKADLVFDKVKYNNATPEQKINTLVFELAKNMYMYSDSDNPKTEQEWIDLSDEERNNVINQLKSKTKENGDTISAFMSKLSDKGAVSMVDGAMSAVQAANHAGISIAEYQKMPSEQKEELMYEYLYLLDEDDKYNGRESSFSDVDREFWDRNNLIAESTNFYFKQKGEDRNVCPGDASRILREEKVSFEKVKLDYLQNKKDNNKELSEYEQQQYEYLSKYNEDGDSILVKLASQEVREYSNPPSAYMELLENKEQAEFFNDNILPAKKASIISSIVEKKTEFGTQEYYEQMMASAKDALIKGDDELAHELTQKALQSCPKEATNIDNETSATELQLKTRAGSVVLSAEEYAQQAASINKLENEELRIATGQSMREIAPEDKMIALSEIEVKDTEVQKSNVDMRNRAKDKKIQLELNKNIAEKCNIEARKYAIQTTKDLHKEVQLEALNEQLKDAEPELVRTAAEVPSTLHKDNQVEALKAVKKTSQKLSEDDAKEVELILADQVSKSHKDNQLAMHEEIMKSEYSEVQERAAANIKDYDHSVQSKAIDVVYESGNSNAVQKVIENLEKMPPDIQKNEVTRLVGEIALSNSVSVNELEKHLMGGELSAGDLSKMTPTQRREYFLKQFEEAPPAKKLEILMKMASSMSGIHQRTIYTVIARFSPSLLKGMVERGLGKTMLEAGLPIDAVNKIIGVMKTSTNNEVIGQLNELKQDSSFEKYFANEQDIQNNKNATIPNDLKTAFASPIDKPTYKKLKDNNATMYIKS